MAATTILNTTGEDAYVPGCVDMMHEVSETYQMDHTKEKKITERIIAHQLIILENTNMTSKSTIEAIKIKEFNPNMDEKESTIKMSEGSA